MSQVLNHNQKKEHLEQENAYHTTLVLHHALPVSREVEALLMRDPRMLSRNPQIFTNYDGVMADLLAQVQSHAGETRDLREKCRESTAKESLLWREKWLQGICQVQLLVPKCLGIPVLEHKTQSLYDGLPTLKTGPQTTRSFWSRIIAQ